MPRPAKGPRLYLRTGRTDARTGRALPDLYSIRDGANEVGTGCGPGRLREAEEALARYIAAKWAPPPTARGAGDGPDHPADVSVAEVLTLYAEARAPELADPVSTGGRIKALLAWWGYKTLADVKRSTCKAYVAHRIAQPLARATRAATPRLVSAQGARRELEDLSAAIGYWAEERSLTARPSVWRPLKPESPRGALTRPQAAALLKASLGYRRGPDGRWERLGGATRAIRAHLRRFILIGLYTGTRAGVIRALLWEESVRQAWVDLDAGVIYRRGRAERDAKTKRRPVVRIPPRLLAHLRRWRALDAKKSAAMAQGAEAAGQEAPTPIVSVLHRGGRPLTAKLRRGFASCAADARLPPEVTPHWLRHTAATWLMEAGANPWDAAAFMGMTMETLERHYGHQRPTHQAEVAGSKRRRL